MYVAQHAFIMVNMDYFQIFNNTKDYTGMEVGLSSDRLTGKEMAEIFGRVYPDKKFKHVDVSAHLDPLYVHILFIHIYYMKGLYCRACPQQWVA